ncbi:MAG: aminopeptidase [Patescibacteria group bacterium]
MYIPSKKILDKYAKVLVRFALNSGRGIKKDDVVLLHVPESAKRLYVALRNEVLCAGGTFISQYMPDGVAREYYELASSEQLRAFHAKYYRGLVDQIDHSVFIAAESDMHELEGIPPKKIILRHRSFKPYQLWREEKESKGKFTWTIGLYGTPAMAREARMSLKGYWRQIIKACFLDYANPVTQWKKVFLDIQTTQRALNRLPIESLEVKGDGIDLKVRIGKGRRWLGGSGRNIPSFELFISPDWRGAEGTIQFDQPLYRYGNLVEGITLVFQNGEVVRAHAKNNENLLKEMIKTDPGAGRIGEFSLTDRTLSRITKFMADTLYDENRGGEFGNMHLALGKAYKDSYTGNAARLSKAQWRSLGFNESAIHTDFVTTTRKTVTAILKGGKRKIIYQDGRFIL